MGGHLGVEVFEAEAGVPFVVAVTHYLFRVSLVCYRYGFQGFEAGVGGKVEPSLVFRRRS